MPSSPEEIQLFLEWAGKKILSLRGQNPYPQSYRTFWPDYPDDKFTAYGYTNEVLRPSSPAKNEIALVDEIMSLVLLVPVEIQRRVLNARALISPINNRYIFPWTRIARIVHLDPKTVKAHHKRGLDYIVRRIKERDVGRFREIVGLTQ